MEGNNRNHLGQHFLIDFRIISKIIDSCNVGNNDVVLELGTGFGYLTKEISTLTKAVYSYEIDSELYSKAKKYLANNANVKIYNEDFFAREHFAFDFFLTNMPYSRSKDIVKWLTFHEFREAVVMVQKEFSDKIMSSPGDKNYSLISVLSQYCFDIEPLFDVEKSSFLPPPKIQSKVLRLRKRKIKITQDIIKWLEYIFNNRNKNISSLFSINEYGSKKIHQLNVEALIKLCNRLTASKNPDHNQLK